MSGLWCLLLGFLASASFVRHTAKYLVALADTYAQTGDLSLDPVTAITLWQFGPYLAPLPHEPGLLMPLGTASGGVATTYLFQVVNPAAVTTTNDGGLLSTEVILSTKRPVPAATIVVSASGWFRSYPDLTLIDVCRQVNSAFGDCIEIIGEIALTAAPTSSAALTVPPTPTSSSVRLTVPPTPTSSASSSASDPTSKPSSVRTGTIVGGVVGGLAVLGTVVAPCVLYRRRRRRLFENIEDEITPRAFTNGVSAPAVPLRDKGTLPVDANVPSSAATHRPRLRHEPSRAPAAGEENTPAGGISGLTIPELARMLRAYERVHRHNVQVHEDSPPPSYLS
ncbi:hypothetical protein GGX14DRAFT_560875 [Mycena pura]|uniref:Mid2 domain-containing protein n=1 Tax=Mycena pura TaxID=153505 RepID=A0AAD6YFI1_9AGAR|nr:hypothetical protein GGX14DRAFT_560875 [Mycena pura]